MPYINVTNYESHYSEILADSSPSWMFTSALTTKKGSTEKISSISVSYTYKNKISVLSTVLYSVRFFLELNLSTFYFYRPLKAMTEIIVQFKETQKEKPTKTTRQTSADAHIFSKKW